MKRICALAAAVVVAGGLVAGAAGSARLAASAGGEPRFRVMDVWVESDAPLAAYQIEVVAGGDAALVGVEGGETPFTEAPYYDPAAHQQGRVVVAAYSLVAPPPAGRRRVASLHVRELGAVSYQARVEVAGDANGRRIAARVTIEVRKEAP